MAANYSFQNYNKEIMARASVQNEAISLKKSVETANFIRGKKVSTVINFLERVAEQKAVVPYKRFNAEMGHKKGKGIDTGGYPVNVAKEFLRLIKAAVKNASELEITGDLYLVGISARKGIAKYHYGRYMGRKMKSTSVEVIVGPKEKKAKVAEVKEK